MKFLIRLFEYLRYLIFWGLDFLKGSKVKNHLTEIAYILENFATSQAAEKRGVHLKNLLKHTVETTKFYKKNKDFNTIEDFPIINKSIIMALSKEFKSYKYLNQDLKVISTSGSTGVPFKLKQNKNKVLRHTADAMYFSNQADFKIGYRILYLRNWDVYLKKSRFGYWKQNIEALEVVNLNDSYISKIISKMKTDFSNKVWLGYPSGYELICRYLDKIESSPINANVKAVIAMSETLNSYTKKSMSKYFKAPVVSRYSNSENGIIAQQPADGSNHFIINWASYFVEILELNSDKLAKSDVLGRIVVTDLFNYAEPLIRYDTGDLGTMDYDLVPPVLKTIEGRKSDAIYNTNGKIISSIIVDNVSNYTGIIQGQLIQELQKEYTLKLNVSEAFHQEASIITEFKGYLGNDANIKVLYVDEIPIIASGKRKTTINEYIKNNNVNSLT